MIKSLLSFIGWRLLLVIGVYFGTLLFLQNNFLGGGFSQYLENPQFWWHANFDGEHYLAIAREGYRPLRHFFFPVYPLLIRYFSFWATNLAGFLTGAIFISHTSFFLAILGLQKLLKLDGHNFYKVVLILLIFPTSFYFAAAYTESLFLMLAVWSFYFARRSKFLFASLLAAVAGATRVIGVVLIVSIAVEWYVQQKPSFNFKRALNISMYLFVMALGLFVYLWYLYDQTGDPLVFIHKVGIYGGQRSSSFVMLPQVFYRYLFKIIPALNFYWPVIFTTYLELFMAVLFLILVVVGYFKLRFSYWIYLFGGFLIPTLSGSFSSLPRYVLVLFPGFMLIAQIAKKLPKIVNYILAGVSLGCLILATAMFSRGFWIS